MNAPRRLILASGSPRRALLMRDHGFTFEVVAPPLDEPSDWPGGLSASERAEAISLFKARSVAANVEDALVLAGDTLAVLSKLRFNLHSQASPLPSETRTNCAFSPGTGLGGRVFGKPEDREGARAILTALAGTTHEVITGVTLIDTSSGDRTTEHERTAVTMRALSAGEIEAYLDTEAWRGKAGAYGIQDRGDAFVERIRGSFTNVVGFPMELVCRLLASRGVEGRSPQR